MLVAGPVSEVEMAGEERRGCGRLLEGSLDFGPMSRRVAKALAADPFDTRGDDKTGTWPSIRSAKEKSAR
eukprot:6952483-Pyramimonas_sp.AAC.1